MSTPPGERVGRWTLVAPIGRGGMAEVWRARPSDGRGPDVALKRALPQLAGEESFARMFAAEARVAVELSHPNIVRVVDAGEGYLAMELVEGWSLARIAGALRPRGRGASPKAAVAIARAVASALGYVHLRGLVHRDVSPSNVLVATDGSVKLCDFGIAKALDGVSDTRTRTGALKGKIPYMSPEQASGLPVDARSDQFSLGALLHELLTGRRLFDGAGDLATLALVRAAEVDPPSMGIAGVSRALDEICLRLLARSPAERFPDCAAVERALADHPGSDADVAALVDELRREEAAGATRSAKRTRSLHRPARAGRRRGWVGVGLAVAGFATVVVGGALVLRARRATPSIPVEQKIAPPPAPAEAPATPPPVEKAAPPSLPPSPAATVTPPSLPLRTHRRHAPTQEEQLRRQIKRGRPVDPFAE